MVYVASLPNAEVSINSWNKHIMQYIEVTWICRVKNSTLLQVVEKMVINVEDTLINISPQSFYPRIVDTAPYNHAPSSRTT